MKNKRGFSNEINDQFAKCMTLSQWSVCGFSIISSINLKVFIWEFTLLIYNLKNNAFFSKTHLQLFTTK